MTEQIFLDEILNWPPDSLPPLRPPTEGISHAPKRVTGLKSEEEVQAVKNALRYLPAEFHEQMGAEFLDELHRYGHIYGYRFRPEAPVYARPIEQYPARCQQAAAIMLMVNNNLDPAVAQHPEELITYGGNGSVFQNWMQYRLFMKLLSELEEDQTIAMYSGHPHSVFPSGPECPRVVVTNGMTIPNFSREIDYQRGYALGVTQYGQMTAGSYMYIGPQGIVHGTALTVLNAGRMHCGESLAGKLFVTSGLGGMSGAQAKAGPIAGAVTVVAEVNEKALMKRHAQGWLDEVHSPETLIPRIREAQAARQAVSLGFNGNIVDLWELLLREGVKVDLGSDQTSLHSPYGGGYYPAGLSFDEANRCLAEDPVRFKELVHVSLRRHVAAVKEMAQRGMYFFDYGNAFLRMSAEAGADVLKEDGTFIFPSYVQDIMGPLCFDYGFGPFRWVCTSGAAEDLAQSDQIAAEVLKDLIRRAPQEIAQQLNDNLSWIEAAQQNRLVVGSQARILYSDADGRIAIAKALNQAVAEGRISAPIVIGRDHHDVSGTDSPYRETANIYDGSDFTADMAVQNVIGDAMRGATWVSLHNGGGVGWGWVVNGGFGLLLDGTPAAASRAGNMLYWDVLNGVTRRAWAGNPGALSTARRMMAARPELKLTLPLKHS